MKPINIFTIFIVFMVSFAIYSNSLQNSFVYDDKIVIEDNYFIRDWANLPLLISKDYFKASGELTYRPMVTLSYFFDYSLWGLNPLGYHLTNIILHGLNAILVYLLVRNFNREDGKDDWGLALFSSLIFAVHPILTEAVNVISFREDILTALFFLGAFILFIKSDQPWIIDKNGNHANPLPPIPARKRLHIPFYASSLILYLFALLCKEMAITLPFILILFDLSINLRNKKYLYERMLAGFSARRFILYKIRFIYPGLFIISGIYLLLRFIIFYNPSERLSHIEGSSLANLLTMPKVVVAYIKLFFTPFHLNADYIVQYSYSFKDKSFLLSSLTLIVILIYAIKSWRCLSSSSRSRYIFFSISWFFISLIPVINIVPILNIMAERYLYIPSIGLVIFIGLMFEYESDIKRQAQRISSPVTGKRLPGNGKVSLILFILLISFYSILTIRRNYDWKDDLSLWSKTVKQSPQSFRAHHNLGIAYAKIGLFDEALSEFKLTLDINKDYANVYNDIGNIYIIKGLPDKAATEIKKAILLDDKFSMAYYNLANIYAGKGELDMAIAGYKRALEINPYFPEAYNNLGNAFLAKDMLDEAIYQFYKATTLKEDYFDAHNNLGVAYNRKEMLNKAIIEYNIALQLRPESADIHCNLAIVYEKSGDLDKAISEYKMALNINPSHLYSHYNLATIYSSIGELDKAIFELEEILRIDPDYEDAAIIKDTIKTLKVRLKTDNYE